jgi:beta-glucosidase
VTVKNTGRVPGREVVQVYISAPKGKVKKPESELKVFGKTKMLAPGESQTLYFPVKMRDWASYDPSCSCWIVEAGTYTVKVGASSLDVKSSTQFEVPKDLIVEKSKVTLPRANVKEIEPRSKLLQD